MIEEAKTLFKIIKKYFIIIFIIPFFISLITYYFFRVTEKQSNIIYYYNYLIDVEDLDFDAIEDNISILTDTFSYLNMPFGFKKKFSESINFDQHVQNFYLAFYKKLETDFKELKKEALVHNVHTNGYRHDEVINYNSFNDFHHKTNSFHLYFRSDYTDENYYKLFFLDIFNEANKAYSESILEDVNYNSEKIFNSLRRITYIIDSHLESLQSHIDYTKTDIENIKNFFAGGADESTLSTSNIARVLQDVPS